MIALLAALTLTAGSFDRAPSFEPTLFDDSTIPQEAGGDAGVGGKLAFVALGTVASVFLQPIFSPVVYVGLGALLGVDVSWGSAFVGAGFGIIAGAVAGITTYRLLPQEGIVTLLFALAGAGVGYALCAPLFTLLDPFGLATPRGEDRVSPAPAAPASDVTIEVVETRPGETSAARRVGTGFTMWSGRF